MSMYFDLYFIYSNTRGEQNRTQKPKNRQKLMKPKPINRQFGLRFFKNQNFWFEFGFLYGKNKRNRINQLYKNIYYIHNIHI